MGKAVVNSLAVAMNESRLERGIGGSEQWLANSMTNVGC